MDSALISSIMSGVGSLAGTALSAIGNKRERKYTMQLMNHQYDQNLAAWQLQNEYNSPESQMGRLVRAGLNPNLVYGNGSAANTAGSISTPVPQNLDGYRKDYGDLGASEAINKYYQGVSSNLAIEQMRINNDLADADYQLKQKQIKQAETEWQLKEIDLLKEKILTSSNEDEASIYEQQLSLALNGMVMDNVYKMGTLKQQKQDYLISKKEFEKLDSTIDNIIANTNLTKEQQKNLKYDIQLKLSQIRLNNANATAAEFENEVNRAVKPLLMEYGLTPNGSTWQAVGFSIFKLLERPWVQDLINNFKGNKTGSSTSNWLDSLSRFFKSGVTSFGRYGTSTFHK